ncbi:MAG TPA: TolC family protein [Pirellulaceae bacterium]|nr:TolC family protein [Pirellulaceae bacterium]
MREANQAADLKHYIATAAEWSAAPPESVASGEYVSALQPRTLLEQPPTENMYWNLTLEEAIQTGVARSTVLRELGGSILRTPGVVPTILDPAIQETDPRFGVYGALAAFDAEYFARIAAEKNDRALNNLFTAGGTRVFQQDLLTFQHQIAKRSAFGTEMAIRQNIDYDSNNAIANLFPSVWNTNIEAEVRQPLLQGAGATFNRIAGPGNAPGVYNGVVIARNNNDISLADFELALRNLVSDIENTYWDLYYAYRDLDAKVAARNASLEIWRKVAAKQGVEPAREAQAREQYFRFEEEVQNALAGRPGDGTTTHNGTTGGVFRGNGGVLYSERRLRLIVGLDLRDDQLIRPTDEPTLAPIMFSWPDISAEAIVRRGELRRQRLSIRRRELELIAARNFLLPQFDVFGRYRWRGFGHDLIDYERAPQRFDNAFQDLTTGDFQEWQMGGEFKLPIGFRRGHAAVRNAQLLLVRERSMLEEQERKVLYDLSNAYADLERAIKVSQTAYNRRMAARTNVDILRERMEWDPQFNLDQLLEAERRFADSDVRYYRAVVEYAQAVKSVHFEKGTLLDYGHVYLSDEERSSSEVHDQAYRNRLQEAEGLLSYVVSKPGKAPEPVVVEQPAKVTPAAATAPPPSVAKVSPPVVQKVAPVEVASLPTAEPLQVDPQELDRSLKLFPQKPAESDRTEVSVLVDKSASKEPVAELPVEIKRLPPLSEQAPSPATPATTPSKKQKDRFFTTIFGGK